jgi:hypothetical protein
MLNQGDGMTIVMVNSMISPLIDDETETAICHSTPYKWPPLKRTYGRGWLPVGGRP